MSVHPVLRQLVAPATQAVRYAVGGFVISAVSGVLALIGVAFLSAAGFTLLRDQVGVVEALTISGLMFLAVAVLVRLIGSLRAPPPPPVPDPAAQLAFDLGVSLGRTFARRKG